MASSSPAPIIRAMIRALALETSGRRGSVALAEDGHPVAVERFDYGLQNAARILPLIDQLTRSRNWKPTDLRELYISIGPGSFTGLRIGVTLAKTLAFATAAKIVAVPTVDVLAANAPPEARELIIVLDAKRGQIFTARLSRRYGRWTHDEPPKLDTLAAMLSRAGRPVHLLGDGIPYHRESIPSEDGVFVVPAETWVGRAEVVAALGYAMAREGKTTDALALTPLYIRRPEAEEKADQMRN